MQFCRICFSNWKEIQFELDFSNSLQCNFWIVLETLWLLAWEFPLSTSILRSLWMKLWFWICQFSNDHCKWSRVTFRVDSELNQIELVVLPAPIPLSGCLSVNHSSEMLSFSILKKYFEKNLQYKSIATLHSRQWTMKIPGEAIQITWWRVQRHYDLSYSSSAQPIRARVISMLFYNWC